MISEKKAQIYGALDEDFEYLKKLWKYCFTDSDAFREWYFEEYYDMNECLVIKKEGNAVASLQIIDTKIQMGNAILQAGYIVGVNCLPEYRGQGYTDQLMQNALFTYAKEKNLDFMMLMPFEADFYLRYGFCFGTYHYNMTLSIEEFYDKKAYKDTKPFLWKDAITDNSPLWNDDIPNLYEQWCQKFDGYVVRTRRHWNAFKNDLYIENGYMKVLYNNRDEAVGYIAYLLQEEKIYIKEMVYLTDEVREIFYYFIASHRSQVKLVEWSASEGERIVYDRKKDKHSVAFYPFMMYLVLKPTIISAFASHQPSVDIRFSVKNKGTYIWKKNSDRIIHLSDQVNESDFVWENESLTKLIFNGSFSETANGNASTEPLRQLFSKKIQIFNNEYF